MRDFGCHAVGAAAGGRRPRLWGWRFHRERDRALRAMIGSYFYIRFQRVDVATERHPEPSLVVPLVLRRARSTSVPMVLGALAARRGRLRAARGSCSRSPLLQAGYFATEVHDFDELAPTPQDHAYGSIYYTLLGADHAHVCVGLLSTSGSSRSSRAASRHIG